MAKVKTTMELKGGGVLPFTRMLVCNGEDTFFLMREAPQALSIEPKNYVKAERDYMEWLGDGNYFAQKEGGIVPFSGNMMIDKDKNIYFIRQFLESLKFTPADFKQAKKDFVNFIEKNQ